MNECLIVGLLIVAKAKLLSRRLCTLPDPPSRVTYMLWNK